MPLTAGNDTDEELLRSYKESGDVKVLGMLYDRFIPMVYGVCLKYLKDREESKDAVMHIFEKLVLTLRSHAVSNFKSWLYVTSKNYCLMQIRGSKGRYFQELQDSGMDYELPVHLEPSEERELNLIKLEKCLGELGQEQQSCVKLFYLQQKCYKEITDLTGYDDSKVKSYIQNGKRNLKICMEKNA